MPDLQIQSLIPDGQGGVLVSWSQNTTNRWVYNLHISDVTSGGVRDYATTGGSGSYEMVLGDNGTAFVNGGGTVTAFDLTSMAPLWTYQAPTGNGMSIITSSAGGGLVAKTTDGSNYDTVIRLDPTGTPTTDNWTGAQLDYSNGGTFTAALVSPPRMAAISAAPIDEAPASGTRPRGDPQHNGTTDPGLVLVATQDCHKAKTEGSTSIWARYPIYSLRLASNLNQTPACIPQSGAQCYTVFEFIPNHPSNCGVGGYNNLDPCEYAPGTG